MKLLHSFKLLMLSSCLKEVLPLNEIVMPCPLPCPYYHLPSLSVHLNACTSSYLEPWDEALGPLLCFLSHCLQRCACTLCSCSLAAMAFFNIWGTLGINSIVCTNFSIYFYLFFPFCNGNNPFLGSFASWKSTQQCLPSRVAWSFPQGTRFLAIGFLSISAFHFISGSRGKYWSKGPKLQLHRVNKASTSKHGDYCEEYWTVCLKFVKRVGFMLPYAKYGNYGRW